MSKSPRGGRGATRFQELGFQAGVPLDSKSSVSKQSQVGTAVPHWLRLEAVIKPAWNVPIADCTVDNPWWQAQKMPETCRVLWQNEFWIFDASSCLFYTNPNMKFHKNYFSRSDAVPLADRPTDSQTDGHDEPSSCFSQLCECAQNLKKRKRPVT
jgi:hypothetical protein